MTGRERVLNALKCRPVDRTPWVPFVGCHAGALIGAPADETLRSEELIARGVGEAVRRYRADGVPVCFDLQIGRKHSAASLPGPGRIRRR